MITPKENIVERQSYKTRDGYKATIFRTNVPDNQEIDPRKKRTISGKVDICGVDTKLSWTSDGDYKSTVRGKGTHKYDLIADWVEFEQFDTEADTIKSLQRQLAEETNRTIMYKSKSDSYAAQLKMYAPKCPFNEGDIVKPSTADKFGIFKYLEIKEIIYGKVTLWDTTIELLPQDYDSWVFVAATLEVNRRKK